MVVLRYVYTYIRVLPQQQQKKKKLRIGNYVSQLMVFTKKIRSYITFKSAVIVKAA